MTTSVITEDPQETTNIANSPEDGSRCVDDTTIAAPLHTLKGRIDRHLTSLGTKTTALIAASFFITLLTASLFLLHYEGELLKRTILEGLDGQAKVASNGIGSFLDDGLSASNAVAASLPTDDLFRGRLDEVQPYLKQMSETFPAFQNGMFILDREGKMLVDYPPHPEMRGESFAFREYYQRTLQEQKGVVGLPYKSTRTGKTVLTFTAPVRDASGQIIAIVGCSADLLSQEALGGYRKQKFGKSGYLYVFDKSRELVLHPDPTRELTYVEAGKNKVLESALTGFEGAGETVNSAGVPMLLAVRRIPHTDWFVGAQVPQSEAYAPIAESRVRIFYVLSLAMVGAILIGGTAIRRATRPLQQLEQVASRISTDLEEAETKGVYKPSPFVLDDLHHIRSRDEIGLLASSFVRLGTKLNLTLASLQHSAEAGRLQASALESAANAIVITGRDGVIQWINPAFTRMTGYTAEEVLGKTPRILKSGKHDVSFYENLWKTILSGDVWHGSITNRRKDGSLYVCETTITPVRSADGAIDNFISIKADITERLGAQEALVESESRYRSLFENMLEGYAHCKMIFDDRGRPIDFVYLAVNNAFGTLTGLESVVGKRVTELIPGIKESQPELFEKYGRVAMTGEPERFEIELKALGIWFSISAYGAGTGCFVATFDNVTERKRAELSLREAGEQYRTIFEENSIGICNSTGDGRYLSVNRAFARIFGYKSPEEMLVLAPNAKPLYVDPNTHREIGRQLREQGKCENREFQVYRKDGAEIWLRSSVRAVYNTDGGLLYYVGSAEDITEQKRLEDQVQYLAYYDALTGLANRALLEDRLAKALASARRHKGEKVAVLYLDLDRFKNINDSLGHSAGDLLLKEVADRLKRVAREQDTVARLGGDEFVIVLTAIKDAADAAVAADRLVKAMTTGLAIHGQLLSVTFSLGISVFPDHGRDGEDLLKNADAAMYWAKENGRNRFQFFTPEMNRRAVERMELERGLRLALERKEFFLEYQPQVNLATGEITGAEALVRWRHPQSGLIPPGKFITIAENSGLIIPIGEWVLRTACAQARQWQDEGLPAIPVAVNVSAVQFRQESFVQLVEKVLRETGLPPQYLELELTESLLLSNTDGMLSMLRELKEKGVKLSIDDFGTGYSSLSYLRSFPVYKLKIDRSFVQAITMNRDDAAITTTIINMAKSLDMKCIAEGAETDEQIFFLRAAKCDEVQGYYFSRPVTASDFAEKLRSAPFLECPQGEIQGAKSS